MHPRTLNRTRGADPHLATLAPPLQATRQVDRALPVPARSSSASSDSTCAALTSAGGAPASTASSRQTRVRTAPGQGRQRRGVGPARRPACGRARPRRGRRGGRRPRAAGRPMRARAAATPGPRSGSSVAQQPPGPDPAEGRVRVVRVVPRVEARRPRRPARWWRAARASSGRANASRRRGIPARDRAPEPAGEAEQDLLGLVVAGVPEQHALGAEAAAAACRAS